METPDVCSIARSPNLRALVTGANGFMGTWMVEILGRPRFATQAEYDENPEAVAKMPAREPRYDIVATDIGPSMGPDLTKATLWSSDNVQYAQCDLRDNGQVAKFLRAHGPFDVVFHVAGLFNYSASGKDLYDVNVGGSLNLLQTLSFLRMPPKRIIVWGAAGVYDFTKRYPNGIPETAPTNPKGGYLLTKYVEEMQMLTQGARLGIPVTVIRPGGVYGPRSRYGVALSIRMAARGGMGPLYFGPGNTRAGMVHAADVCLAAEFLTHVAEAAGEIYNVNDDTAYTTAELMRRCTEELEFPLWKPNLPIGIMRFFIGNLTKKAGKMGRVSRMNPEMTDLMAYDALLDATKLKKLGWRPRYPDSINGLLETIESYRKEGSL